MESAPHPNLLPACREKERAVVAATIHPKPIMTDQAPISGVLFQARIDQFAAHQEQRRLVIQLEVAERVGQDFGHPDQAGHDVADEEQLHGPEQQAANADGEPDLGNLPHEISRRHPGREDTEQGRIGEQHQRRQRPDHQQHDLALQIVSDLDLFLVLVRRLVDVVVALRLEEQMTGLPRGHGHQPADQGSGHGIHENHGVADEEAEGADKVQSLVDPAVMVVAMVIPALLPQFRQEAIHSSS